MAQANDLALHARLVAGDPTATLDCIELWLPELVKLLTMRFPTVMSRDEHIIATVATDTLLSYIGNPQKYDPQRATLRHYLFMAVRSDLRNALRPLTRRDKGEIPLEAVEVTLSAGNSDIEEIVERKVDVEGIWQQVMEALPEPLDRQVLTLLLEGERSTLSFAKILGIDRLPASEQKAIVKRHKDRISKRLERLREKLDE